MPGGGNVLLSGGFDTAALEVLKTRFTTPRLLSIMDILREALQDSYKSGGGRLGAEVCLMRLCALAQEVAEARAPAASPARAAAQPETSADRKAEKLPASKPLPKKTDVQDAAPRATARSVASSEPAEEPNTPLPQRAIPGRDTKRARKIDDPVARHLADTTQTTARTEATVTIRTKAAYNANVIAAPPSSRLLRKPRPTY